jgi:Sortase domain
MALEVHYAKERHPGRVALIIIVIALLAAAGWYGYRWYTTGQQPPIPLPLASANSAIDESDVTTAQIDAHTAAGNEPRYVRIDSLDSGNARVYGMGIDSNDLLEAPANSHDVAWYKNSGTPGGGGIIIMNAHSKGNTRDGVFAGIGDIKKDASIVIQTGDGGIFTYHVVDARSMTLDEFTTTGMKSMGTSADTGTEGLNLTTFDGKWVPKLGTFDKRIIVRALIDE